MCRRLVVGGSVSYFLAVGGWKSIDFLGLVAFATKIGTQKRERLETRRAAATGRCH